MGNIFGAERKRATDLPLKKLNDSVWELYSPEEGVPDVEIIFFHGLQLSDFEEAFWRTWLALEEGYVIWPKEWLSKIFPKARILFIDYSSSARGEQPFDLYLLGENLVRDITEAHIGENCPVILVGHCLGGIVIKRLLSSLLTHKNLHGDVDGRSRKFFENVQGAFFYATPHGGSSELGDLIHILRKRSKSPYLALLESINRTAVRINEEYRLLRRSGIPWNAHTFAVSEGYPTTYQEFDDIVVSEASARRDVDNFDTVVMADHFTVCRAKSQRDSPVIGRLVEFIVMTSDTITVSENVDCSY